jgi:hypothetical protein
MGFFQFHKEPLERALSQKFNVSQSFFSSSIRNHPNEHFPRNSTSLNHFFQFHKKPLEQAISQKLNVPQSFFSSSIRNHLNEHGLSIENYQEMYHTAAEYEVTVRGAIGHAQVRIYFNY